MNEDQYAVILDKLLQSHEKSHELSQNLWRLQELSLAGSLMQKFERRQSRLLEQSMNLERSLQRLRKLSLLLERSMNLERSLELSILLERSMEQSITLKLSLARSLSSVRLLSLERLLKRSQLYVEKLLSEFEKLKESIKDSKQVNNVDATSYAVKLPCLIKWLNPETQTWFMDMRIDWYQVPALNRRTHIYVWLKTYKSLIFDHCLFRFWDKIKSRSLYRDRIYRVKDSK